MRKLLFILLVLFTTSVMAKKRVDLNRDFNLSGKLYAYTETESSEDLIICKEGSKWHLTNEYIAGRNHVKFWIAAPDSDEDIFFTRWSSDDLKVSLFIDEEGKKKYLIDDAVFNNLLMLEVEEGYIVRKCSVLLEE